MEKDEVLRVENLKKYFPVRKGLLQLISSREREYVHAVDDVSFSVHEGEILGFIGESGCGKTTLGRILLRLIEPSSGQICFDGIDVTSLNRKELKSLRRKMQMIFQDPHGSLNPRRVVSEIMRQTVQIHRLAEGKAEEDELIRNALEEVELKPAEEFWNRYPILLSGGQRQRVGIGRVLILQPKLVIADEPISMLDVSVRMGILELLLRLRDRFGISLIYISHDLATARCVCDRIAIMYLGKIVEIAPTEDIINNPLHPYTQALILAVPVPDPTVKLHDVPIKGYVPLTPTEVFSSCRFHPRCPYALEKCHQEEPPLIKVGHDHYVACTRATKAN
ncbi:MAG: ABC transporter ATP-binding protein [Dehalococcoidia bacterium]|nr:MAG: ABC transporter ATP-binding protein [Dehalococcoidia bacterium]